MLRDVKVALCLSAGFDPVDHSLLLLPSITFCLLLTLSSSYLPISFAALSPLLIFFFFRSATPASFLLAHVFFIFISPLLTPSSPWLHVTLDS